MVHFLFATVVCFAAALDSQAMYSPNVILATLQPLTSTLGQPCLQREIQVIVNRLLGITSNIEVGLPLSIGYLLYSGPSRVPSGAPK